MAIAATPKLTTLVNRLARRKLPFITVVAGRVLAVQLGVRLAPLPRARAAR
jgi:hypothetical protein